MTERVTKWVLLDGNRLAVTGAVLAAVATFFFAAEWFQWFPLERSTPTFYVFSSLVSGNLTLITVVVSINQLLLGRELKSPGELESQIENIIDYRREVEESTGEIAPVKPLGFLRLVFEGTRQEAQRAGGLVTYVREGDAEVQSAVEDLVTELTDHFDDLLELLEGENASTFEVLSVTLNTNYAETIHRIRRIRSAYGGDLSDETMDALSDLIGSIQRVDVARQYFKSLYLQDELSSLSRVLLYAGIPAEVVAVSMLFAMTGSATEIPYDRIALPLAVTVGFLPLALLFAFIVRTATVTQRTTATIPFTTPEQEQ